MNMEVLPLFPTAVTINEVGGLTNEELKIIKSFKTKNNVYNKMSIDHRVLNHPELSNLKSKFEKCFSNYMDDVLLSSDDVKPNITQSWLNYTKTGEKHKSHYHSNSFLSAVYYIQTDDFDSMQMDKTLPNPWCLSQKEWNEFNSTNWKIPATQGRIIVFPSTMIHKVRTKKTDSFTRISLACNMIPSGTFGGDDFLNKLEL